LTPANSVTMTSRTNAIAKMSNPLIKSLQGRPEAPPDALSVCQQSRGAGSAGALKF
jgi:hypothetical protein